MHTHSSLGTGVQTLHCIAIAMSTFTNEVEMVVLLFLIKEDSKECVCFDLRDYGCVTQVKHKHLVSECSQEPVPGCLFCFG